METSRVKIIHCPTIRCNKCPFSTSPTCKQLVAINNSDFPVKVVLSEPKRKTIHFGGINSKCPVSPPWFVDGWETIFLGKNNTILDYSKDIFDVFLVEPYLSIFWHKTPDNQLSHKSFPLVKTPLELDLLEKLCTQSSQFIPPKSLSRIQLNERIQHIQSNVFEFISQSIPELSEKTRIRIAKIVSHHTTVLGPLFPALLDDKIEEVYFDKPESHIYFDHQDMGRCLSDITLSNEDTIRIITLLRSESNQHLDQMNPSLKTELNILGNMLRIAISIPPLSSDGLHFEIRRTRVRPFTLLDLIKNETLTLEAAAILLLAITSRFNITITGAPSSGKTTLLNALDMTTPRWWRKIYIEDVLESRVLQEHHQVRIKVNPVDEMNRKFEKSTEIIKSLHRSPDYLILGEIQTKEHSQALFKAITAGLHTIQTCHSKSASSLISRWTLNHEVNPSNIALMDLIVTMNKPNPGQSKRIVTEIAEIKREIIDGFLHFSGLNCIYNQNGINGNVNSWVNNVAFKIHANEIGLQNPMLAFDVLVALLRDEIENKTRSPFIPLGEKLYRHTHPMEYSYTFS